MRRQTPSTTDPDARPEPHTFYPPKNNRFVTWFVQRRIRASIRRTLKVTEIRFDDEDLAVLRDLKGKRCLLTPSHSGGFEPHIVMELSRQLGDSFNYLAAMELFQRSALHRWLLPRMGVYSIIRGTVDRASFSMTRKLLAEGKRWLVVFPEGETIWQNSIVLPFQQGVFQLAFKGMEDARKHESQPNLYCIPIAIRYSYLNDMHPEIDASLNRLESRLGIDNKTNCLPRYERMRRVADTVLQANEKAYHFQSPPGSSLNDRAERLKLHAVCQLEQQLGLNPPRDQTLLDRIRALLNAVDRAVFEIEIGTEYEKQLAASRRQSARDQYDALWRVLRFVALHDGYVRDSMTVERLLDVLGLLEMEVFKQRRIWGPRLATVKIGSPVNLRDHAQAYADNRRETIPKVSAMLESSVQSMLQELEKNCHPIVALD